MTWEDDYKLSVLRACGLTVEQIRNVNMSSFVLDVDYSKGSPGWSTGCDTCGSWSTEADSMDILVSYKYIDDDVVNRHYFDNPESVTDFIRKVLSP